LEAKFFLNFHFLKVCIKHKGEDNNHISGGFFLNNIAIGLYNNNNYYNDKNGIKKVKVITKNYQRYNKNDILQKKFFNVFKIKKPINEEEIDYDKVNLDSSNIIRNGINENDEINIDEINKFNNNEKSINNNNLSNNSNKNEFTFRIINNHINLKNVYEGNKNNDKNNSNTNMYNNNIFNNNDINKKSSIDDVNKKKEKEKKEIKFENAGMYDKKEKIEKSSNGRKASEDNIENNVGEGKIKNDLTRKENVEKEISKELKKGNMANPNPNIHVNKGKKIGKSNILILF
jgi:hypothetical protein